MPRENKGNVSLLCEIDSKQRNQAEAMNMNKVKPHINEQPMRVSESPTSGNPRMHSREPH